jgi:alanine racemase
MGAATPPPMKKKIPSRLRAWAEVDLAALERNLKAIRNAMPHHLKTIAVVKANAYGHGIAPVVSRLMRTGVSAFAVANLEEAARIRELGSGWPILALSVLLPSEYKEAQRLRVSPTISSIEEVHNLAKLAQTDQLPIGVHVKIDTGMGRLGIWYPQFAELLAAIQASPLQLEGICTHFAAADVDLPFTELQRQRFIDCLTQSDPKALRNLLIHADNSAGIQTFHPTGPFNAIRIGLLQFGINAGPHGALGVIPTEPVLSFRCRVGLTKTLPAGATVSYGRSCTLRRQTRIAVLTAGYADGLPTSLSNRGTVIIGGKSCPILGRITMDQCMADVTELTDNPAPGQVATFIGADGPTCISASDYASASGQIVWEALCTLSKRTTRVYLNDSAI